MNNEKEIINRAAKKDWHALAVEETFKILQTSKAGLSHEEALRRKKTLGENKIIFQKNISSFKIFITQFNSPLVYILFASSFISLLFKHYIDAGVILSAVLFNAIIGFIQEKKANSSLEKLRNLIVPFSVVIREGENIEIPNEELVPGDIIYVRNGDKVPADCRLIETENLEINEAILTGESAASLKSEKTVKTGASLGDRSCLAYMGTSVVKGKGLAVIIATGSGTEFGRLVGLLGSVNEEETPLQIRLRKFSNQLGILILFICLAIFLAGVALGYDIFQIFISSIAIAVSAIPEGLPVAITVILTIGMQLILKRKALVRKLIAVETLGSVTVICTDKTGTLTEGRMKVNKLIFFEKEIDLRQKIKKDTTARLIAHALRAGSLCNDGIFEKNEEEDQWKMVGSPVDEAMFSASLEKGLNFNREKENYPLIKEIPFDSENKYMASLHEARIKTKFIRHNYILFFKGAPEIVLERANFKIMEDGKASKLTAKDKEKMIIKLKKFSSSGVRLIALAFKPVKAYSPTFDLMEESKDLIFICLVAINDPLRPEARETIKSCRQAGIRPVIITGDYKLTAKAIAREAGISISSKTVIEGAELDLIDDGELRKKAKKINLYARVSPEHKLRIIKALRDNGEVVAMVGDGVNDAAAIKASDIGIALGSGSEVTKEVSDMVLLNNNFSTIVAAIEQGRVIFLNVRKVITFLTSDSFSEMIIIIGSMLFRLPLALLPGQILWINIIHDSFPNFSLPFEKGEKDIMKEKPFKREEPLINKEMKYIIFGAGLVRDLFILGIFYFLLRNNHDISYIRTVTFAAIGISSLMYIFSLRSLKYQIWEYNPFANKYLLLSIMISFLFLLLAIYWAPLQTILYTTDLDYNIWPLIVSTGIISIGMIEMIKYFFNRGAHNS